ncbi:MAG TPA: hypothetical protein VJR89_20125 [Polyangiales bacterium]|nr:hypothetical protein [Polyangiales bacterium]
MGTLLTRKQFLERTQRNTPEPINERIRYETELSIARTLASGPGALEARLKELDREWDTERTLQTLASSFVLTGLALGATWSRKWLILPGVVAGFLLQHSLQGWCPPLPVIRALGVRTQAEIDVERYALKAARGDFGHVHGSVNARALLQAASRA